MPAVLDSARASLPQGPGALTPEHFIPVSRYDLRAMLSEMLTAQGGDERAYGRALDNLAAWRHQHYRQRLLDLLEDYLPFSPDSDTLDLRELDEAGRAKSKAEFLAGVEHLLVQANYTRLDEDELQRLLIARSPHGLYLEVDLSDFDDVLLYYRGSAIETREARNPWRLYLRERFDEHIFKRLFLLLKLKPTEVRVTEIMAVRGVDRAHAERIVARRRKHLPIGVSSAHIYVKIFKRIPQISLEMLFPNTRIEFRPFDKLKLAVTAGGGTAAGVMGTATKVLAATNPFTLAFGIFGLSAVIFRQVMSFFNTRNRYMMELAQNLYFCSLANNRGALTLLADRAEEEDAKEDMLLYAFLVGTPVRRVEVGALKDAIGALLAKRCGVDVSFDVEDALGRLLADGVVADHDGTLTALTPNDASAHLDRRWDRLLDAEASDPAATATAHG
jgi:Protein of unknown function (DUF3754)